MVIYDLLIINIFKQFFKINIQKNINGDIHYHVKNVSESYINIYNENSTCHNQVNVVSSFFVKIEDDDDTYAN